MDSNTFSSDILRSLQEEMSPERNHSDPSILFRWYSMLLSSHPSTHSYAEKIFQYATRWSQFEQSAFKQYGITITSNSTYIRAAQEWDAGWNALIQEMHKTSKFPTQKWIPKLFYQDNTTLSPEHISELADEVFHALGDLLSETNPNALQPEWMKLTEAQYIPFTRPDDTRRVSSVIEDDFTIFWTQTMATLNAMTEKDLNTFEQELKTLFKQESAISSNPVKPNMKNSLTGTNPMFTLKQFTQQIKQLPTMVAATAAGQKFSSSSSSRSIYFTWKVQRVSILMMLMLVLFTSMFNNTGLTNVINQVTNVLTIPLGALSAGIALSDSTSPVIATQALNTAVTIAVQKTATILNPNSKLLDLQSRGEVEQESKKLVDKKRLGKTYQTQNGEWVPAYSVFSPPIVRSSVTYTDKFAYDRQELKGLEKDVQQMITIPNSEEFVQFLREHIRITNQEEYKEYFNDRILKMQTADQSFFTLDMLYGMGFYDAYIDYMLQLGAVLKPENEFITSTLYYDKLASELDQKAYMVQQQYEGMLTKGVSNPFQQQVLDNYAIIASQGGVLNESIIRKLVGGPNSPLLALHLSQFFKDEQYNTLKSSYKSDWPARLLGMKFREESTSENILSNIPKILDSIYVPGMSSEDIRKQYISEISKQLFKDSNQAFSNPTNQLSESSNLLFSKSFHRVMTARYNELYRQFVKPVSEIPSLQVQECRLLLVHMVKGLLVTAGESLNTDVFKQTLNYFTKDPESSIPEIRKARFDASTILDGKWFYSRLNYNSLSRGVQFLEKYMNYLAIQSDQSRDLVLTQMDVLVSQQLETTNQQLVTSSSNQQLSITNISRPVKTFFTVSTTSLTAQGLYLKIQELNHFFLQEWGSSGAPQSYVNLWMDPELLQQRIALLHGLLSVTDEEGKHHDLQDTTSEFWKHDSKVKNENTLLTDYGLDILLHLPPLLSSELYNQIQRSLQIYEMESADSIQPDEGIPLNRRAYWFSFSTYDEFVNARNKYKLSALSYIHTMVDPICVMSMHRECRHSGLFNQIRKEVQKELSKELEDIQSASLTKYNTPQTPSQLGGLAPLVTHRIQTSFMEHLWTFNALTISATPLLASLAFYLWKWRTKVDISNSKGSPMPFGSQQSRVIYSSESSTMISLFLRMTKTAVTSEASQFVVLLFNMFLHGSLALNGLMSIATSSLPALPVFEVDIGVDISSLISYSWSGIIVPYVSYALIPTTIPQYMVLGGVIGTSLKMYYQGKSVTDIVKKWIGNITQVTGFAADIIKQVLANLFGRDLGLSLISIIWIVYHNYTIQLNAIEMNKTILPNESSHVNYLFSNTASAYILQNGLPMLFDLISTYILKPATNGEQGGSSLSQNIFLMMTKYVSINYAKNPSFFFPLFALILRSQLVIHSAATFVLNMEILQRARKSKLGLSDTTLQTDLLHMTGFLHDKLHLIWTYFPKSASDSLFYAALIEEDTEQGFIGGVVKSEYQAERYVSNEIEKSSLNKYSLPSVTTEIFNKVTESISKVVSSNPLKKQKPSGPLRMSSRSKKVNDIDSELRGRSKSRSRY